MTMDQGRAFIASVPWRAVQMRPEVRLMYRSTGHDPCVRQRAPMPPPRSPVVLVVLERYEDGTAIVAIARGVPVKALRPAITSRRVVPDDTGDGRDRCPCG